MLLCAQLFLGVERFVPCGRYRTVGAWRISFCGGVFLVWFCLVWFGVVLFDGFVRYAGSRGVL